MSRLQPPSCARSCTSRRRGGLARGAGGAPGSGVLRRDTPSPRAARPGSPQSTHAPTHYYTDDRSLKRGGRSQTPSPAVSPRSEGFCGQWVGAKTGLSGSRGLAQGAFSRFQILKSVSNHYQARSANGIQLQRAPRGFELSPRNQD